MISIEGRVFHPSQQKEAVAFLEGMIEELQRHVFVEVEGYPMLLDDHRDLEKILKDEPALYLH